MYVMNVFIVHYTYRLHWNKIESVNNTAKTLPIGYDGDISIHNAL